MTRVSKKVFLEAHSNVLADDVLSEILESISFMKDEHNDMIGDSGSIDRTEYIISITVEERI